MVNRSVDPPVPARSQVKKPGLQARHGRRVQLPRCQSRNEPLESLKAAQGDPLTGFEEQRLFRWVIVRAILAFGGQCENGVLGPCGWRFAHPALGTNIGEHVKNVQQARPDSSLFVATTEGFSRHRSVAEFR